MTSLRCLSFFPLPRRRRAEVLMRCRGLARFMRKTKPTASNFQLRPQHVRSSEVGQVLLMCRAFSWFSRKRQADWVNLSCALLAAALYAQSKDCYVMAMRPPVRRQNNAQQRVTRASIVQKPQSPGLLFHPPLLSVFDPFPSTTDLRCQSCTAIPLPGQVPIRADLRPSRSQRTTQFSTQHGWVLL